METQSPCHTHDWKVRGMSWRLTQITITHSYWECKLNFLPLSRSGISQVGRPSVYKPQEQPYVQIHFCVHTHKHIYANISGVRVSLFAGSPDVNLTFQSTEEECFVSCQWADDMSSWQWFKMHQTLPKTSLQLFHLFGSISVVLSYSSIFYRSWVNWV